jgi:hypothetical protein
VPAPAPVPVAGPKKRPVPTAASQKESDKLIQNLFKAEYARKSAPERVALAKKLLDLARQTNNDPDGKYVLLREARDIAAAAVAMPVATEAIDETVKEYDVDARALRGAALQAAAAGAVSVEDQKALAPVLLKVADEAMAAEDYAGAEKAAAAAAALGRKAKDVSLVVRAEAKAKESGEWRARFDKFRKALDGIAKNPNSAEDCTTAGYFYVTIKNDWPSGLPLLARGSNAALKDVAARDLAAPADPRARTLIADDWWDAAEREQGAARDAFRRRAASWYEQAAPALTGFSRVKADRRVAEVKAPR